MNIRGARHDQIGTPQKGIESTGPVSWLKERRSSDHMFRSICLIDLSFENLSIIFTDLFSWWM